MQSSLPNKVEKQCILLAFIIRKTTLFMDQCSGDMKYALKMVEKNLNNLCRFSLSISNSDCKYSRVSLNCILTITQLCGHPTH